MSNPSVSESSRTALRAWERGWQPIPIRDGDKRPHGSAWGDLRFEDETGLTTDFDQWAISGASGVGLLLGEPSGGLVDVDLDHPKAVRMRDHFLPPTAMQTGRPSRPHSHRWYIATPFHDGESERLPATRRYKMTHGEVSVELRSTGSQTVIPPSVHPDVEPYHWEGEPFGGADGPTVVNGQVLATQVALLGLSAVLLEVWPQSGSRHDAYLALAGGLLRYGEGVHPFWERNLPVLIKALAEVTGDEDGGDSRVHEVMETTLKRLRSEGQAVGFPRLAEILGDEEMQAIRRMAREVESLASSEPYAPRKDKDEEFLSPLNSTRLDAPIEVEEDAERDPMSERISTWAEVDLGPYLSGEVTEPEPSILTRADGHGLIYSGLVNSLYGKSESGKTWVAMHAGMQEIAKGERVLYLDFEDQPVGVIKRFRLLGMMDDDLYNHLIYVRPEDPIAEMQRGRFGSQVTPQGRANSSVFAEVLARLDPTLIIVDGMSEIYGMHGHDTNDAAGTAVITSWLKQLTREGRSAVVVIDHTGKTGKGAPIGAHHKTAMVQGSSLRVDVIDRLMPGKVGRLRLVVHKDRVGAVRAVASDEEDQVATDVIVDSTIPGKVRMSLVDYNSRIRSLADDEDKADMMTRISAAEQRFKQVLDHFAGDLDRSITVKELSTDLNLSGSIARDTLNNLTQRGHLTRSKGRSSGGAPGYSYSLHPDPPPLDAD